MKIVFFGTPRFSAEILKDLIRRGVQVTAVVTQPDKVQGRHLRYHESAVKQVARELIPSVPLLQPERVRDSSFLESIESVDADFYVVVAFGQIFPKALLDKPTYGCINVHTSLLPKYRGAAPIQRCLIEGEKETGVAIMYMAEKCDAGDILSLKKLQLSDDMTSGELTLELCRLAQEILYPTLVGVRKGEIHGKKQDESQVTFAKKVTPETAKIDWSKSAKSIYNLYRGVTPKPGAWCTIILRGKKTRLKILKMALDSKTGQPKEVIDYKPEGIVIGTAKGSIRLIKIQVEGKKPLDVHSFIRGSSLKDVSFDVD